MLHLRIPLSPEGWDEEKNEFVDPVTVTLELEHSLVSLQKWESKWCRSFMDKPPNTAEETLDYIKCMTLTEGVNPDVYNFLTTENITSVNEYIGSPMTATTFSKDEKGKGGREVVTAELIYYWMVALQIPSEYRYWHLNQLLTLIKVCNIKNAPPKKMSKRDIMSRNAKLNAARRKQMNTSG